jgi:hypothetical protein
VDSRSWVAQRGDAVRFRVRVQPRASRTEVAELQEDALRIRLAAPPVEGEANEELVRFLAKRLRVAPSRVTVVSGAAGRRKVIEVGGLSADDVARALFP